MLLIYLSNVSTRTKYILDLVFNKEFGIEYKTTCDQNVFNSHAEEKINYSFSKKNNEFFIKASPLLFENFIKNQNIPVQEKFETKVLFSNNAECDLGFDIFS